jgi:ribonuclease BN (tRNA processing enzyme)
VTKIRTLLLLIGLGGLTVVWGLSWVSKHIEHVGSGIAPLQTRVFDGFQIIALGTGVGQGNPYRRGPAVGFAFREKLILVDAGAGVVEAMRLAEIPPGQPSMLFLSSLLPENVAGLDDLLIARSQAEAPELTILGPTGAEDLVSRIWSAHRDGLKAQAEVMALDLPRPPIISELKEPKVLSNGDLEITWEAMGKGPVEVFAYSVRHNEKTVVLSSRIFDPERILDLGLGADLWIHGAMVREAMEAAIEAGADAEKIKEAAQYLTALEDIGELATQMEARAVVLTRLMPPPIFAFQYNRLVGKTYSGRVAVASDGQVFSP